MEKSADGVLSPTTTSVAPAPSLPLPSPTSSVLSLAPRATAAITAIMLLFSLIGLVVPWASEFLAFSPGTFVGRHLYAWTMFTGPLFHVISTQFGELLVNVIVVWWAGCYLEKFWGEFEFGKFLLLVSAAGSAASLMTNLLAFQLLGDSTFLFSPISGAAGISAGLLTAMKQLRPEEELFGSGLRTKHLPLAFVLSTTVYMLLLEMETPSNILSMLVSWLTAWVYLRWFQHHADGSQGDDNGEFNFASFFPAATQPVIFFISRILQRVCCFWMPKKKSTNVRTSFGSFVSILDSPQDAERRRAVAMKALDEKFAKMQLTSVKVDKPPAPQPQ